MTSDFFIISHTDMDGFSAAAVTVSGLNKLYPDIGDFTDGLSKNCLFVNYPKEFPIDEVPNNNIVIISDVSFTNATIDSLISICKKSKRVYWFDHHASSNNIKDKLDDIDNLYFIISNSICGAAITYSFFKYVISKNINIEFNDDFISKVKLIKPADLPKFIMYVDDYDRWIHKYVESTYLMYGMRTITKSTYIELSQNTLSSTYKMDSIIQKGKYIYEYKIYENKQVADEYKFVVDIPYEDTILKMICINTHGNSFAFGDDYYKYYLCCIFNYSGIEKRWIYSIYANNESIKNGIKANIICEKYGGGGHPGAAGFSSKELIFI